MSSFAAAATARRQSVPYDRNGHIMHQAQQQVPLRPGSACSGSGSGSGSSSSSQLKRVGSERQDLSGRGVEKGTAGAAAATTGGGGNSSTGGSSRRRSSVQSITSECSLNSGIRCSVTGILEGIRGWEPPNNFSSEYYFEICGRSLIGSPVLIIKLGQWDFRKISSSSAKQEWVRYMDYMYSKVDDKMRKNSKIVERVVSQFVAVIDFHGFTMKQVLSMNGLGNIRSLIKRYETSYCGAMEACFVVNASTSFRMLCGVMKPLLSSNTIGSLQVYGSNQNEWKNALLGRIAEEHLPFSLGGSLVPPGVLQMDYKKLVYGRRYSIFAQAVQEKEIEGDDDEYEDEEEQEEENTNISSGPANASSVTLQDANATNL